MIMHANAIARVRRLHGFSLVEVIVAIGVVALSVVGLFGLLAHSGDSSERLAARATAIRLGDAIEIELMRLRDAAPGDAPDGGLGELAALMRNESDDTPLRLVAVRDGIRVVRESDADSPEHRIPLRDRFYRVDVQRQSGALAYEENDAVLAYTVEVRWPYMAAAGPEANDAVAADPLRASRVRLNLAISR